MRLEAKFQTSRSFLPAPLIETMEKAKIAIIASGSADFAVSEARCQLLKESIPTDYMRIRSVPFSKEVEQFVFDHDRCYVVELNQLGQLKQLLTLEYPDRATNLKKLAHIDGLPLTALWIKDNIISLEGR